MLMKKIEVDIKIASTTHPVDELTVFASAMCNAELKLQQNHLIDQINYCFQQGQR